LRNYKGVDSAFRNSIQALSDAYPGANLHFVKLLAMATFSDFDIDQSEAVLRNDPEKIHKEFDVLRQKCPVIHTKQYNGYWILTRFYPIP
jgi:hypothetical protein